MTFQSLTGVLSQCREAAREYIGGMDGFRRFFQEWTISRIKVIKNAYFYFAKLARDDLIYRRKQKLSRRRVWNLFYPFLYHEQ